MIQPFLSRHRRLILVAIAGGLVSCLATDLVTSVLARPTSPDGKGGERVVFLAGKVAGDDLIILAAAVAAARPQAVLLLDSPRATENIKTFLAAYQPDRVVPVGDFPAGLAEAEHSLGTKLAAPVDWRSLFPKAERAVVCPSRPRGLLLQAACLAAALKAPLVLATGEVRAEVELRRRLRRWKTREVYVVGATARAVGELPDVRRFVLKDEAAVAGAHRQVLGDRGPIQGLVVANPADEAPGLGGMSVLAPWVVAQHRSILLLTNDRGDNVPAVVGAAIREPEVRRANYLTLVASLRAIPTERRPNPAAGKDLEIEMEPLTPTGAEPFSFATGRLFHGDPAVVALMLARRHLVARKTAPLRALVVSNPGGGLPLLETFSRNTAQEFHNAGLRTTALFDREVTGAEVRRLLPEQDVFLWEGHHETLVRRYGLPGWGEPLPSTVVFLQSCLALNEEEAHPLLRRGAVAVAGSATRTYSGSGGAFTLAFFDALLYEHQSLGGGLRQAKNFLLAYSLLKEKRLGANARLNGVNLRSAWAFSLWGDPALKLPPAELPPDAWTPVRPHVRGNQVIVTLPDRAYDPVVKGKFHARMRPNARLAGLLRKDDDDEEDRDFVPFVFAEVHLPRVPAGQTPRLRSRIPDRNWVFCWDGRRGTGYLLVTPRPRDQRELRFQVELDDAARAATP
jgi:hypothetical protein